MPVEAFSFFSVFSTLSVTDLMSTSLRIDSSITLFVSALIGISILSSLILFINTGSSSSPKTSNMKLASFFTSERCCVVTPSAKRKGVGEDPLSPQLNKKRESIVSEISKYLCIVYSLPARQLRKSCRIFGKLSTLCEVLKASMNMRAVCRMQQK